MVSAPQFLLSTVTSDKNRTTIVFIVDSSISAVMETKQEQPFILKELFEDVTLPLSLELEHAALAGNNRLLDSADEFTDITLAIPVTRSGPPERADFRGCYDFEIGIHSAGSHKKKYIYSNELNRLYVDLCCDFPMQYTWRFEDAPRPMYVRACVAFADESQAQKRVERCLQHIHERQSAGLEPHVVYNVLRSSSQMATPGIYYCGDPAAPDSWFSVLVEFPVVPENGFCSHVYNFVCKNSCSSGINRRSIEIVFTLEDISGQVYGRSRMGVRVCACPRRDIDKDLESEKGLKRPEKRRMQVPASLVKRPRSGTPPGADEVITIPSGIQVVGAKVLLTGLSVMHSMMEHAMQCKKDDAKTVERYSKPIASIKSLMDQLKGQSQSQ